MTQRPARGAFPAHHRGRRGIPVMQVARLTRRPARRGRPGGGGSTGPHRSSRCVPGRSPPAGCPARPDHQRTVTAPAAPGSGCPGAAGAVSRYAAVLRRGRRGQAACAAPPTASGWPAGGLAVADATMIAGVMPAPRDVRIRGCAGSTSSTLAVAATSMLTATPDAFVSESMPRPLLTTAPGNAVGGRSPRPGRRQHFLPEFLIQNFPPTPRGGRHPGAPPSPRCRTTGVFQPRSPAPGPAPHGRNVHAHQTN